MTDGTTSREVLQPSYYSVTPADVRYNPNLTPNAKLLYGEISALCNKEGYCWATNDYFAKLYCVKVLAVKRWIKSLEDEGHIHVLLDATGTRRRLCIDEAVSKKICRGIKNDTGWYPKRYAPRIRKDTQSITLTTPKKKKTNTPVAQATMPSTDTQAEEFFSSFSEGEKEPERIAASPPASGDDRLPGETALQAARRKHPECFVGIDARRAAKKAALEAAEKGTGE